MIGGKVQVGVVEEGVVEEGVTEVMVEVNMEDDWRSKTLVRAPHIHNPVSAAGKLHYHHHRYR